jgi:hypothetical protein
MAFSASILHSVAWPASAIVIASIFRKPLAAAINRGVRRLKAGPVEVEFDQEMAEVRQELRSSPELAAAEVPVLNGVLSADLARLAEISPQSAVLEAFKRIEGRLEELLEDAGASVLPDRRPSAVAIARMARRLEQISDETLAAVEGLAVLRDLAAHSPRDEIDAARARDYLALADAVLFALRSKPGA